MNRPKNRTDLAVSMVAWTAAMRGRLGQGVDVRIASELGIPSRAVWIERRRIGIAPFRNDHRLTWTPELDALLGTEPDNVLGEWLGMSSASVNHRRRLLGIESYSGKSLATAIEWTPKMVKELGRIPLRKFARAWGVPLTAARLERERRSIRPLVEPILLPEEVIRQLGRVRDTELSRRFAIPRKQLTGYRKTHSIPSFRDQSWHLGWTAKRLKLLGKVSDIVLAKRWKVSEGYLRAERRRRGIPPSKAPAHWTAAMRAYLGKEPDTKVAERFGLTLHQVVGERHRLGIRGKQTPKPAFCWLPQHDWLLGTAVDVKIAKQLGISKTQVASRRWRLGVTAWRLAQPESSSKLPRHRPAE